MSLTDTDLDAIETGLADGTGDVILDRRLAMAVFAQAREANRLRDELSRLRDELESVREDSRRLGWMFAKFMPVELLGILESAPSMTLLNDPIRSAIDAARKDL